MLSNILDDKLVQLSRGLGVQQVKILTPDGEVMTTEDVTYDPENQCFFIKDL